MSFAEGEAQATILAAAGLRRLGMIDKAAGILSIEEMLPAGGQGIIGVTLHVDAPQWLREAVAKTNDESAQLAAVAEPGEHADLAIRRDVGQHGHRQQHRERAGGEARAHAVCPAGEDDRNAPAEHHACGIGAAQEGQLLCEHVAGLQIGHQQDVGVGCLRGWHVRSTPSVCRVPGRWRAVAWAGRSGANDVMPTSRGHGSVMPTV